MTLEKSSHTAVDYYRGRATASAISAELKRAARKARTPASIVSGGGGFRARRADRYFWIGLVCSFALLVLIPVLASAIYFGLIASNQYVTEARLALRESDAGLLDTISGAIGMPSARQGQTALIIASYVKSRPIVEEIGGRIDLRAMFSDSSIDYFSRFQHDEPIEELVKFWARHVDAHVDRMSGIITLEVRTFTAESSLDLTNRIISEAEKLVNLMSQRSRKDMLNTSQRELELAQKKLRTTTTAMRDLRNAEGVLDATTAGNALQKIITDLRLELSHAEQQFAVQRSALSSDSPQMRILGARMKNLNEQIANYTARIASDRGATETIVGQMSKLARQQIELDLAEKQYAAAVADYESARLNIETQQSYLIPFLRPTLPEKSTHPKRLWMFSIITMAALFLWGLIAASAFLARDHMAG